VFGSDEMAKKFLETPDVKYGDVTLIREYRSVNKLTCYTVTCFVVTSVNTHLYHSCFFWRSS